MAQKSTSRPGIKGKARRHQKPSAREREPQRARSDAGRQALRLIVGIGASAGGLQAFKTFFTNMPADSGMAFVLVQHLDPKHQSLLAELVGTTTAMRVLAAQDGIQPAANHVYVIPPDATLRIAGGKLRVTKPAPPREHRRPIDTFFSSLAEDQEGKAVGVILSGGGSDGSEGVRAIKEHGGLTMAQADFNSHAMSGMPSSAAATGLVDHVLAVEEMPAKLVAYHRHLQEVAGHTGPDGMRQDTVAHLAQICGLLRAAVGHDFSQYKEKTLTRRIQRRMQVLQIDSTQAYIERLRKEPREADLLFRELLIGVTHFFRDSAAFDALETQVIPQLIAGRSANDTVRVWVPACATGQEVYSIAVLLKEAAEKSDSPPQFQIFATDIDDRAVTVARAARYRKSEFADMSAARLDRWFAADGDHYCPIKEIRERCIFSTHSVVKDPPFSRLDLVSCRNLLIYLETPLQDRLIRTFHYALRPGGFLFLGNAENVTRHGKLLAPLDSKHRIFQRRDGPAALPAPPPGAAPAVAVRAAERAASLSENSVEKSARRLMEKHAPAYVVVDSNHDVLRFSGQTDKYLGPAPGAASLNLLSLIRRGLRPATRGALAKALASGRPVMHEALAIDVNGVRQLVDLAVEPIPDSDEGLFVVAFFDRKPDSGGKGPAQPAQDRPAEILENELRTTRERLEAAVEQLETANEEMKSANEEYQSVNEELQSTNEELETSKEEMQSVNEELQTVNAELNSKNSTLMHLNSDLKNLLDSTQIATLFLDRQLRIRSFTPPTTELFHVRDSDRGRPVTDIASQLDYAGLRKDAIQVMRDLVVIEREVSIQDEGPSFLMRLRPYRTVDNVIDGVVITFIDISDRKRHEQERARLAAIVNSSDDAIIGMDLNAAVTNWNEGAEMLFGWSAKEIVGKPITLLIPADRQNEEIAFFERLQRGETVDHYETVRRRKDGGLIEVALTLSPIRNAEGGIIGVSKIAQDVSARNRDRKRADELQALMMDELNHRVKNTLATVQSIARQSLKGVLDTEARQAFDARLVALSQTHNLVARQSWEGVALRELLLQELRPFRSKQGDSFVLEGPDLDLSPKAALALGLAIHELTINAAKYGALSSPAGRVRVTWEVARSSPGVLRLKWEETGGPPVTETGHKGFGTVVIQRGLALELNGEVRVALDPGGLICTIEIPLSALGGEGKGVGVADAA